MTHVVRVEDVQKAEAALDKAMEELRSYSEDWAAWPAHERLGDNDLKTLVVHRTHFEKLEVLQNNVQRAMGTLQATQRLAAGNWSF